TEISGTSEGCP
ncbi:putative conjugative transfer protein TraD, partial [Escherichia coli EC1865]